jgi:hemerythrin superfamily protein
MTMAEQETRKKPFTKINFDKITDHFKEYGIEFKDMEIKEAKALAKQFRKYADDKAEEARGKIKEEVEQMKKANKIHYDKIEWDKLDQNGYKYDEELFSSR